MVRSPCQIAHVTISCISSGHDPAPGLRVSVETNRSYSPRKGSDVLIRGSRTLEQAIFLRAKYKRRDIIQARNLAYIRLLKRVRGQSHIQTFYTSLSAVSKQLFLYTYDTGESRRSLSLYPSKITTVLVLACRTVRIRLECKEMTSTFTSQ